MRSPLVISPRLSAFRATRSRVLGVESVNFRQPPSSVPAVELLLNQTSDTVIHTCEYCAGVLPVSDTSVRAEHAARRRQTRLPSEAGSAAGKRLFMQFPERGVASIILRPSGRCNARDVRQVCLIVPVCLAPHFRVPPTLDAPRQSLYSARRQTVRRPVSAPWAPRFTIRSSLASDRRSLSSRASLRAE